MSVGRSLLAALCAALILMACAMTSQAAIVPAGDATRVHVASAGATYRGYFELRNQGDAPATIRLRQTDYSFDADGNSVFGVAGTLTRSNAAWLHLDREQVAIASHDTVKVEYEVRVPDDAQLAGTYWSVVMAEELSAIEASGKAAQQGTTVRQQIRYAIQIITEVGETGRSEIAFHDARLSSDAGRRTLSIDVENTGERWLRASVWIELHDLQGRLLGRFAGSKRRTFPGTSIRDRIDLTSAPRGKYLALLVVDGGRNDLFGTQIELDLR